MSAADLRGVLILPLLVLCFGFVGAGMVVPAFVAGVAVGWCSGASGGTASWKEDA